MKKRFLFLLLLPSFLTAQAAFPQNVSTSLSRSESYVGETVYLSFSLQTEEKPVLKPLRAVLGLKIEYQGENVSTQVTTTIVNGRRQTRTVYQYRFTYAVTGEKPGVYIIPQTTVSVGDREMSTSPAKLTVKEIERNEKYRLILRVENGERVYVGESVDLTVELEISSEIGTPEIEIPFLNGTELSPVKNYTETDAGNIKINDGYFPVKREEAIRSRAVFSARLRFTAQTPGVYSFDEARASFRAVTSVRESVDIFGRTVADKQYESVVIPAESGQLEILALPQPQPADFSGIVGVPRLSAEADLTEAFVGDPITYRLTVEGVENVPSDLPPLNRIDSFESHFRIPEHHSPAMNENGKTVFVYTIRPLSADVDEIPAYPCVVFNPESESYETVTASALPLKVNPSPALVEEQIEEFSFDSAEREKVSMEKIENLLPANPSASALLKKESRFPYRPLFWIVYAVSFVIALIPIAAAVILCLRKRRSPTLASRKRELLQRFESLLRRNDGKKLESFLNLLNEYDDVKAVCPVCSVIEDEVERALFSGSAGEFDAGEAFARLKEGLR